MNFVNILKKISIITIFILFFYINGFNVKNYFIFEDFLFLISFGVVIFEFIDKLLGYKNSEYNLIEYAKKIKIELLIILFFIMILISVQIMDKIRFINIIALLISIWFFIKGSLRLISKTKIINPSMLVVLSFSTISIIGGLILYLPKMSKSSISLIDSIFVATSALCVTGLSPISITDAFTHNGLITILTLIQLGGIGIMSFSAIMIFILSNISIKEYSFISQSLPKINGISSKNIIIHIFSLTIIIEAIGAFFLYFSSGKIENHLFSSIFHSISAFCNAGFSLNNNSMINFNNNSLYLFSIMALIFLGGIGFPVIVDILNNFGTDKKFKLNTKLSITVSLILVFIGWGFFFFDKSLVDLNNNSHILNSLFLSITARTAGFNSTNLVSINDISYIILIFLMFIGASSGGTGGGIKTNSISVIILAIWNTLKGNKKITIFNRHIETKFVFLSISFISLYVIISFLGIIALYLTDNITLKQTIFEVISALSTVGLTWDTTPQLTTNGKIIIIILMLIGRVGPLTFFLSFFNKRRNGFRKYAKEEILVG